MNSALPISSTLIYFLPETVRRPTVEDTSYSTLSAITPIVSLCLFPSTVYDTYFVGNVFPVEVSSESKGDTDISARCQERERGNGRQRRNR